MLTITVPAPAEDVERANIEAALAVCNFSVGAAAKRLGINRSTIYRRLNQYRVEDARVVKDSGRFFLTQKVG